jgi:hypothetical protein
MPDLVDAGLAGLCVAALAVSRYLSPIVLQVIVVATALCVLLASRRPTVRVTENYEEPKDKGTGTEGMPAPGKLLHFVAGHANLGTAGADAAFVPEQPTEMSSAIVGPPSSQAGVFGEFAMFVTIDGAALGTETSSLIKVAGLSGEAMAHIELLLRPTVHGLVELVARIAGEDVAVERPPGAGQYVYWMMRSGQSMHVGVTGQGGTVTASREVKAAVTPSVTAPMRVNSDSRNLGKISLFGVYEGALDESDAAALLAELRRRAVLSDPVVSRISEDLSAALRDAQETVTRNPYGTDAVQDACASITDWTRPNYADAGAKCREAVRQHCEAAPKSAGCECWDEDAPRYLTAACVNHRMAFGPVVGADLGKLTPKQIETVKSSYGLAPAAKQAVAVVPVSTQQLPAPALPALATTPPPPRVRRWYDILLGT